MRTTTTRRIAPDLTAEEHDQVAGLLRDYANRLQREKPSKFDAINADRAQRIRAARFLAENINRTSHETVYLKDDGTVQSVCGFSRTDAPRGWTAADDDPPGKYNGTTAESMAAIQRDLK